jgi:all-trans-retinol dehydrogenase (NAD+)
MNRKVPLRGARVLITGGASGLGRALAVHAAAAGAEVVIWDLDGDAAQRACDEITEAGGTASWDALDITIRAAVDACAQRAGAIDVVINNAGIVTGEWFLDAPSEKIERTYNVNVLAMYWVTRAFLRGMIERNTGCVVTIASAAGLLGVAKQTDYSASKFAAVGFTESLRAELRTQRTTVNTLTVCPFYINTGMFDGVTSRFPLLLPILDVNTVARSVLRGIERGKPMLLMPPFAHVLPWVRLLPVRWQDVIADFFGINKSMNEFRGRR